MKRMAYHGLFIISVLVFVVGCATMESQWKDTQSTNTIEAYEEFLRHYQGEFTQQAESRLEELYFEKAKITNNLETYLEFVQRYSIIDPQHFLELSRSVNDPEKIVSKYLGKNDELDRKFFDLWPDNPQVRAYFGYKRAADGSWQRSWHVATYLLEDVVKVRIPWGGEKIITGEYYALFREYTSVEKIGENLTICFTGDVNPRHLEFSNGKNKLTRIVGTGTSTLGGLELKCVTFYSDWSQFVGYSDFWPGGIFGGVEFRVRSRGMQQWIDKKDNVIVEK